MNIGIDARDIRKPLSGIGRYLLNFIKYADFKKHGFQPILFCNQHTSIDFNLDNLKKVLINENIRYLWDHVYLPAALKEQKIDLFFSHCYKAPLFMPCKFVITIHDMIPFVDYRSGEVIRMTAPVMFLRKYFSEIIARRADVIATVSYSSKKDISRIFGVEPSKIEVVYNSVEAKFSPIRDAKRITDVKNRHSIKNGYILYVGSLRPSKNVDGILRAYSMLPDSLKDSHDMVIIAPNEPNYYMDMSRLISTLRINEKVLFLRNVDDDELAVLYSEASLFVMPSFYEGFGLPLLEAMACGVPCISSPRTSIPEVAGDSCIFVEPDRHDQIADKMRYVLEDKSAQQDLSRKGQGRAKNFSPYECSEKLLKIFENALRR